MTIKVLGHLWTVRYRKMAKDDGRCYYKDRAIVIDPRKEGEARKATLVHEVLHAVYPFLDEDAVAAGEAAVMSALGALGKEEENA